MIRMRLLLIWSESRLGLGSPGPKVVVVGIRLKFAQSYITQSSAFLSAWAMLEGPRIKLISNKK